MAAASAAPEAATSTPEAPAGAADDKETMRLTASTLDGTCASVVVNAKATTEELREAIERELGVPAVRQRLLAGGREIRPGATLREFQLADGAHVDVLRCGWLMPTPSLFKTSMTSSRVRLLGRPSFSSAFTQRYVIEVDVPANRVHMEFWRKNDHDTWDYDVAEGIISGSQQHWMCGDTPFTRKTRPAPLGPLLQQVVDRSLPVLEAEERFWEVPEEVSEHDESDGETTDGAGRGERPCRHGEMPGWFLAPSPGHIELMVPEDLQWPHLPICRLLVDSEGTPVRAALLYNSDRQSIPGRDAVEEYDVEVKMGEEDDEAAGCEGKRAR